MPSRGPKRVGLDHKNDTTLGDMRPRRVKAIQGPLDARVAAMPSKSVTHRALVAAAMASGRSVIHRPLIADDTNITLQGLHDLGVVTDQQPGCWTVDGCAGKVPGGGRLRLGDSGTSLRFLLAVACLGTSVSRLDGSPRLRQRPVDELAAALVEFGAQVELTGRFAGARGRGAVADQARRLGIDHRLNSGRRRRLLLDAGEELAGLGAAVIITGNEDRRHARLAGDRRVQRHLADLPAVDLDPSERKRAKKHGIPGCL